MSSFVIIILCPSNSAAFNQERSNICRTGVFSNVALYIVIKVKTCMSWAARQAWGGISGTLMCGAMIHSVIVGTL